MSIKNPQQDLYETIQFVREGKEEDSENPFAKKGKKGKNPFAKKGDDEDDEDDDAEDDDEGKENPFAKKGKKSKKGKKDDEEDIDEKLNPQQRNMKRAAQIKTGGRVAGGQAAIQKKAGGDKGSSKTVSGTRYLRPRQGGGEHMTKGTTGDLEAKRHGKQLAVRGAGGKDDSNTKRDQERLKQKLLAKRNESFDDDDNAIIEEIKNRVLAVLDERNKE